MFMRITWGRIKEGQWSQFEEAYRSTVEGHKGMAGLKARWLIRDLNEPDAGYAVSLWESEEAMRRYSQDPKLSRELTAPVEPFFAGEYTRVLGEVRYSRDF